MSARLAAVLAPLVISGCGGPSVVAPGVGGEPAPPAIREASAAPAEGATAIELACAEGVPEVENAADDDCDGRIDEDRPVPDARPALTIAATWGDGSDLDLSVVGPDGASGPSARRTSRGACASDEPHARIEDSVWDAPRPGRYAVALASTDACGGPAEPTVAAVSIAALGRVVGVFTVRVPPGGRAEVATVELR